jgi:hypothetical protein
MQRMQWIRSILINPSHKKDLLLDYAATRHFTRVNSLYQLPNWKREFRMRSSQFFIVHLFILIHCWQCRNTVSWSGTFCYCRIKILAQSTKRLQTGWTAGVWFSTKTESFSSTSRLDRPCLPSLKSSHQMCFLASLFFDKTAAISIWSVTSNQRQDYESAELYLHFPICLHDEVLRHKETSIFTFYIMVR